jgi:multidrug transporter EmrE-like cation transporter
VSSLVYAPTDSTEGLTLKVGESVCAALIIKPRAPLAVIKPIWIYVILMAACLFAYSFFKTKAAHYLDATELYPLSQGCSVVLSLLMASIIFKEKINTKCIVGITLSFLALLMINLDLSFIVDFKI